MKKLFVTLVLFIGISSITNAQSENNFDVSKFENALIHQMEISFPGMTLDTTLRFATRATSQKEAGSPECYGTKRGGMVNTSNTEEDEAFKLVANYKAYLKNTLRFDEAAIKRCYFTEFCASATAQYGGLVRYGLLIDNNFTRESLLLASEKIRGEK